MAHGSSGSPRRGLWWFLGAFAVAVFAILIWVGCSGGHSEKFSSHGATEISVPTAEKPPAPAAQEEATAPDIIPTLSEVGKTTVVKFNHGVSGWVRHPSDIEVVGMSTMAGSEQATIETEVRPDYKGTYAHWKLIPGATLSRMLVKTKKK